ncbi:MAG TPA: TonB-dependent receptor plug domain-containing protein, partial [Opitutaceae bacterium]|nr:TonB-dependent receptor plug domain-containing protein [Opitutaceae bacterium]
MKKNRLSLSFLVLIGLCSMRTEAAEANSDSDPVVADGVKSLSKVVVEEQRMKEGAALAEQQNALNIIDVMTASDIQKLPDINAAEALRHVPGVSLWADTGEGRFVAIRGLDSDLNSTTFNGIRLLPTNPATIFGGGRAVALDVIPAGMIGSMVVTKTNKPEQDAEALGGTVDISPKTMPANKSFFAQGRLGSGYEPLRDTPITDISLTTGVRFGPGNSGLKPFTFVGTVNFYTDARGIDDVEPGLNNANANDRSLAGYDQRYYHYHRFRHGYGGELTYQPDNKNRYYLNFFDSGYTEKKLDDILTTNFDGNATTTDNRIFTDTISDGGYQKALVNHIERLTERMAIFGGENEIGNMLLDYKAAHMTGEYKVLKDVTTTFNSVGSGVVTYDNSGSHPIILSATGPDKTNPANYFFGNYRTALPLNKTQEDTLQANLSVPVSFISSAKEVIKFGASYRDKKYNADTTYLSGPANAVGSPSLSNYVEGSNVVYYNKQYQNGPNLSPSLTDNLVAVGGIRQTPSNYIRTLNSHAVDKEKISAGYLQYSLEIGKLGILAGGRVENTKGTYAGDLV